MYTLECAISVSLNDADNEELITALKKAGIKTLEIAATDVCSATEEEQKLYFSKMEKRLTFFKEQGFNLNSFHMTFGPLFCLFNFNDKEREAAVKRTVDICNRIQPFGFNYVVTHTNGWDFPAEGDRVTGLKNLKKSYAAIMNNTSETIAAEVLPRTCLGNTSKEMLEILSGLDGLKVVVDTNHIMQEKEADCIRALAPYLIGLHISDRDEINERHWLPGEGIVDFNAILAALEDIGYKGYFTYEVAKMKTAEDVKNVVENYGSLFAAYNNLKKG